MSNLPVDEVKSPCPLIVQPPIHDPLVVQSKNEPLIVQPIKHDHIIIMITKDLEKEEIDLLKEYGRVIMFDPRVYVNIPIQTLEFNYLIMDLRRREDRYYFQQIDQSVLERYNLVSICHSFEKYDDYHEEVGVENILTKLPDKQAFKADFDRLLLQRKISKPRVVLSCIKSLVRLVKGDWK
jgi:hypothetical protein